MYIFLWCLHRFIGVGVNRFLTCDIGFVRLDPGSHPTEVPPPLRFFAPANAVVDDEARLPSRLHLRERCEVRLLRVYNIAEGVAANDLRKR